MSCTMCGCESCLKILISVSSASRFSSSSSELFSTTLTAYLARSPLCVAACTTEKRPRPSSSPSVYTAATSSTLTCRSVRGERVRFEVLRFKVPAALSREEGGSSERGGYAHRRVPLSGHPGLRPPAGPRQPTPLAAACSRACTCPACFTPVCPFTSPPERMKYTPSHHDRPG